MTGRLRKQLLDKGAVDAVFEGLRLYVSSNQPKFEQCVQFGCRALIGLIMTGLVPTRLCIACVLCVVGGVWWEDQNFFDSKPYDVCNSGLLVFGLNVHMLAFL